MDAIETEKRFKEWATKCAWIKRKSLKRRMFL